VYWHVINTSGSSMNVLRVPRSNALRVWDAPH